MTEKASLKLHLGCADRHLDGWINVDSVPAFAPDLVHDLSNPLPFADQEVEEIMAKDLLEHFDKYMRFVVFYDWTRLLKVSGRITLEVPDFKKTLRRYFKFGFDNFVDYIFGETMFRSDTYIGHFGNHKFAYSQESLQTFVSHFGIVTDTIETRGLNIVFQGVKRRHVRREELDELMIHSHANTFGGTPDLKLGFIRARIEEFHKSEKK